MEPSHKDNEKDTLIVDLFAETHGILEHRTFTIEEIKKLKIAKKAGIVIHREDGNIYTGHTLVADFTKRRKGKCLNK